MSDITFDTFINIIKRPEQILYKTTVKSSAANIAFIGVTEISSGANISIEDKSDSISVNRIYESEVFDFTNTSSLQVKNENFLLTDIYSSKISSGSLVKTPLFFKHKFNISSLDTVKKSSVKIYDDLDNEIDITGTLIDDNYFYSNIESFYNFVGDDFKNSINTEYTFYRIEYLKTNSSGEKVHNELLNNVPVFKESSVETFDWSEVISSLIPNINEKVYSINESETEFTVDFFSPIDVSYKIKDNQKLKLFLPSSKNYTDPWHLKIPNNKVNNQGIIYGISNAQFLDQSFNPIVGVKKVEKEIPTIINKRTIKTDFENLKEDTGLTLYTRVRVTRIISDNLVIPYSITRYYSTNPSEGGNSYILWDSSDTRPEGIKSIDSRTGFIELDGVDLKSTDEIECDYYYNQNYYEFEEIDFNPIRNSTIVERITVIYIDPTPSSDRNLLYKQFKLNQDPLDGASPQETYTQWKTSGSSSDFLILGIVRVVESKGIGDLLVLDTRVEGGSIKESKISEVESKYPDYDGTWDSGSFDGKVYPGNLCYHVEIPSEMIYMNSIRRDHEKAVIVPFSDAVSSGIIKTSCSVDVTTNGGTDLTLTVGLDQFENTSGKFTTFNGSTSTLNLNTSNITGTDLNTLRLNSEFTIDFWIKLDSVTGAGYIFFKPINLGDTYPNGSLSLGWYGSGNSITALRDNFFLEFGDNTGATTLLIPDTPSIDTWYHIAITRDLDNKISFFKDGTLMDGTDLSNNIYNLSNPFSWSNVINPNKNQTSGSFAGAGYTFSDPADLPFSGSLSEFRITKGRELWTSDFSNELPTTQGLCPTSLYKTQAGFTPKEAKDIILNHTALGSYPVARSYSSEIEITSFDFQQSTDPSIFIGTVKWLSLDKNLDRVYYRKSTEENWTRSFNPVVPGTTDTVIERSDSILNLSDDTEYYITVVSSNYLNEDFNGIVNQHINDIDLKLKDISDNPDLAKVIKIRTP